VRLHVEKNIQSSFGVEPGLSDFSQRELSADGEEIQVAVLKGDGCEELGEDDQEGNHEFLEAREHVEDRLDVNLDYSKDFVAAFEHGVLRPDLRYPTADPDGQYCQTEEPVEVNDGQSVTGEVLPIYGPIEEGGEPVVLLDLALEDGAEVVLCGVERVRGKVNLIKPLIQKRKPFVEAGAVLE
jgi:hypothetical protein